MKYLFKMQVILELLTYMRDNMRKQIAWIVKCLAAFV